jgi:hypothetical protein
MLLNEKMSALVHLKLEIVSIRRASFAAAAG